MSTRGWFRRKPLHRPPGAQRTSYDLRERICIGSMTAMETAVYQKVPTDEAEAQMLASADLDDMKSKEASRGQEGQREKGSQKHNKSPPPPHFLSSSATVSADCIHHDLHLLI